MDDPILVLSKLKMNSSKYNLCEIKYALQEFRADKNYNNNKGCVTITYPDTRLNRISAVAGMDLP